MTPSSPLVRRTCATARAVASMLVMAIATATFVQAAGAAPKATEAKPSISRQQQAGHVGGTPQHANRIKVGKPTSTFFGARSGAALTRKTWETGTPVPGRPQMKERAYPITTGVGPNGGFQKSVRVSMNRKGEIHGHPSGKEVR